MSFTGGALALCKVCVKANEICAFAIIFQFITLHLEQIKPKRLQSVTNFQRGGGGGDNWKKGKPEHFAPSSADGTFRRRWPE